MKKLLIYALSLFLGSTLFLTACKKDSSTGTASNEIITESQVHADDQSLVANQTDEVATDASTVAENVIAISGNGPLNYFPPPCNATITYDTLNAVRTITITYNGLNCNGTLSRTGVVTLSIPAGQLWRNAGAQNANQHGEILAREVDFGYEGHAQYAPPIGVHNERRHHVGE